MKKLQKSKPNNLINLKTKTIVFELAGKPSELVELYIQQLWPQMRILQQISHVLNVSGYTNNTFFL